MRNTEMPPLWYAAHAMDLAGGEVVYTEAADEPTETASTIKSPIGVLALYQAMSDWGSEWQQTTLTVRDEQVPRRASTLFGRGPDLQAVAPHIQRVHKGWSAPFGDLLWLNIARSDAAATNVLIEYLGGKERINQQLGSVGLEATELLVDMVDVVPPHDTDLSPRIGVTTMRALAEYYAGLETMLHREVGRAATDHYLSLLRQTKRARLLATDKVDLPGWIEFANKTGSIFDEVEGGPKRAVIADSGLLSMRTAEDTRKLAVAATLHAVRPDLAGINNEFRKLNQVSMGIG